MSGLDVRATALPGAKGDLKLQADFRCHRTRGPGDPEVAGAPGVCGCGFSQARPRSEEVEKAAQASKVVGLTCTAAESCQFGLYCVVVGSRGSRHQLPA